MRRVALAGLVASLFAAHPAVAQESPVTGPSELIAGRNLTQWEVAWTRWSFGLTEKALEAEKECLPQAQPSPVRFLRIPESADHVTTVSCTVPAGTYLLLGEPQVYCTSLDPEPAYPNTPSGLRRCAKHYYRLLTDPHPRVVLDGNAIGNGYKVSTPGFRFTMPAGNYFGLRGRQRGLAAVVGHPALIRPLAPGQHTLIQGERYADTSNIVCVFKLTVV